MYEISIIAEYDDFEFEELPLTALATANSRKSITKRSERAEGALVSLNLWVDHVEIGRVCDVPLWSANRDWVGYPNAAIDLVESLFPHFKFHPEQH